MGEGYIKRISHNGLLVYKNNNNQFLSNILYKNNYQRRYTKGYKEKSGDL